MGMVASIDNSYPKQIKVDPSALQKQDVQNEAVGRVNADSLTVGRNKPVVKPQNRSRVVDEFPSVIKLVKYPSQPNFYPNNNYVTPEMFLHDDRVSNRVGQTIMYNEPGLAGQRKMILYDPHSLQAPKKLVLYKPNQYSHPAQRIMNYYDQSVRDLNITTRDVGARPIPQNIPNLNPVSRFSNDIGYYNNYPQGFVDRRFYNGGSEVQTRDTAGKLVSLPFKDSIIDEGGSGGTSLITVSNTPMRRYSDSAIQTTRELEVITIDRFQDSTGKIYKIVKPVGERTRVVYTKPENILIVETPGQGNYILSKVAEPRHVSDEVKSEPMDQIAPDDSESQFVLDKPEIVPVENPHLISDEPQVVFEDPQIAPEEPPMAPNEPQVITENPLMASETPQIVSEEPQAVSAEVDLLPDEEAAEKSRAPVPHEGKLITKIASLSTSSTQTNPKINYRKVEYHDNKSLQLRINFIKNSAKS